MSVKLLWNDLPQYCDGNGAPYAGAKLFTYAAGSSTKQNTYTTSAGSVANSNPIVLDANGRVPSAVWGTVGQTYKLLLAPSTDTDPPVSPIWTIDNVAPINDTTSAIDQWVAGPAPTFISATSFSLVGDQTTAFHVGRRLKTTNTAGTVYSTITSSVFGALTTVTVVNDSGTLDSGLSAVSYGLVTKSNDSLPRGVFPTMAQHRSYLAGLTLSTAGSSATMSIAAGVAVDSTNVDTMALSSAISKTTSAWAVGSASGGLDTGAIANSTWYHFYLIKRVDTQVVDVLFSTSASAPTMPANYTLKRRIGSGLTNGSAQWVAFTQDGDSFVWSAVVSDISANNPGTSAVSRTLTVPTGVNVSAIINATLASTGTNSIGLLSDLATNDAAPASTVNPGATLSAITTANAVVSNFVIRTNTSAQIRSRVSFSDGNTTLFIFTAGWFDRRGRDS